MAVFGKGFAATAVVVGVEIDGLDADGAAGGQVLVVPKGLGEAEHGEDHTHPKGDDPDSEEEGLHAVAKAAGKAGHYGRHTDEGENNP